MDLLKDTYRNHSKRYKDYSTYSPSKRWLEYKQSSITQTGRKCFFVSLADKTDAIRPITAIVSKNNSLATSGRCERWRVEYSCVVKSKCSFWL